MIRLTKDSQEIVKDACTGTCLKSDSHLPSYDRREKIVNNVTVMNVYSTKLNHPMRFVVQLM